MSRTVATACTCVLALLAVVSSAAAATTSCLPGGGGPRCRVWSAKLVWVSDGDTLRARIPGYGTRNVRFIGVQAMEQSVYSIHPSKRRGQCHALAATARVEQLIRRARGRIRVLAQRPSTRYTTRLGRSVQVRIGGRWVDVGETLIREGLALWLPHVIETAHNRAYNLAQQQARRDRRGLWDDDACGAGPSAGVPIRMWVNWDPPGNDVRALGQEWAKIQNLSFTQPLPIGRWWIRDSNRRQLTFPAGTVIEPRGTVTVYTGRGSRTASSFFWGLDKPMFENSDARDLGDGAYLFDPQGDLRSATIWPCFVDCADPLDGSVAISVQARRNEDIRVTNVTGRPIDLYGSKLEQPGYAYLFGPSSSLEPGQSIEIEPGGDPSDDTQSVRYWGISHPMLVDSGGAMRLTNFTGRTLACESWGAGSCD